MPLTICGQLPQPTNTADWTVYGTSPQSRSTSQPSLSCPQSPDTSPSLYPSEGTVCLCPPAANSLSPQDPQTGQSTVPRPRAVLLPSLLSRVRSHPILLLLL